MEEIYKLEEIIKILEKIKEDGDGKLSIAKAIYTLAIEIKELKSTFIKPKI